MVVVIIMVVLLSEVSITAGAMVANGACFSGGRGGGYGDYCDG